jgi:transcriptional regulator with XRE-family HTH domain
MSTKDTYIDLYEILDTDFSLCQENQLNFVYFKIMGFEENLKQELIYSGMRKKELADISGVNKRAIDTYVRTKSSMPPADTAVKIAKALGVTVEYLVTGEDATISKEISRLTRSILNLNKRDQKLITLLVKAMSESGNA